MTSKCIRISRLYLLIGLVGLGIALGGIGWIYLTGREPPTPEVYEPPGPVSAATAALFASIPIPAEASNIRIAGYTEWIGFGHYVRFEAPVDVCLREAAAVLPGRKLKVIDLSGPDAFPAPKEVFHDFSWFDLDQARDLVGAGDESGEAQVWVDRKRGVFYYCKSS